MNWIKVGPVMLRVVQTGIASLIDRAQEVTGLWTYNRGTSAPFAVSNSSAAKVTNLDADKLDGSHASAFALAAHATQHVNGTDDIQNATAAQKGLATAAQITKLDGIETGATADQTPAEILAAIITVDGAASGLDADLLDGSDASAFAVSGHTHAAMVDVSGTPLAGQLAKWTDANTVEDASIAATDVARLSLANTFADVITLINVGLHLLDTNASHDLIIKPGSDLTADRTLTVTTGDADRTLTLTGNATANQDVSSTGSPSFTAVTTTGLGTFTGGVKVDASTNSAFDALYFRNSSTGASALTRASFRSNSGEQLIIDVFGGGYTGSLGGVNYADMVMIRARSTSSGLWVGTESTDPLYLTTANTVRVHVTSGGLVGIGATPSGGQLHIDQASATGNIPVLYLDQGDSDEPFIQYVGTTEAGTTKSLSSYTTPGTLTGWIRQNINGTDYWVPYYTAPSA